MEDRPRPTRPPPRTPAAIEAELRRRLRQELSEATDQGGQIDDATLAAIIARAIALGLSLHADAEHVRGPQTSNAGWRGAPGPRGRPPRVEQEPFEPGGPPPRYGPKPPFRPRGQRPPPSRGGGFGPRKPRPR